MKTGLLLLGAVLLCWFEKADPHRQVAGQVEVGCVRRHRDQSKQH